MIRKSGKAPEKKPKIGFADRLAFDRDFRGRHGLFAGGDEAGRGPWAGPVTASFVILAEGEAPAEINDSKQVSEPLREELAGWIKAHAAAWSVGWATAAEIDEVNILEATRLAFQRAFEGLPVRPRALLLDHITLGGISLPQESIPKGDSRSLSIAAASLLAKTERDSYMKKLALRFPDYGFERHKGYGTDAHARALGVHGPCPEHRRSFAPVARAVATWNS